MFGNLWIRSRLLALLAVPVAAAVLLCVAEVTTSWGDRARAGREHRAAAAAGRVLAAVHELQEERVRAAAFLADDGRDGLAGLRDRRRRVDAALADYRAAAAGLVPTGDPPSTRPWPLPPSAWTGWPWSGSRSTGGSSPPSGPWPATTPWSTPSSG